MTYPALVMRCSWRLGAWACLAMLVVLCSPGTARAQSWMSDLQVGLATGVEGAGTGSGVGWQRARTRLILSLDLGSDEHAQDAYGVRAFVELERSLSVGGEFGYVRWVIPELNFFFGGVAVIAPRTLFGGTAAANYTFPLGKRMGIAVFTSLSVLPLGSDLPSSGPVMWGLLGIGLRGRL